MSNQSPNFAIKCTYGVLLVDIALYLEQQHPQTQQYYTNQTLHQLILQTPPQQKESYSVLMEQIQKCLASGPPDVFSLQRI
jgi:hypothetical protein